MQIIFEGTPQEILDQIKEYIIRSGYEFSVNDGPNKVVEERIRIIMPPVQEVRIVEIGIDDKKVEPPPVIEQQQATDKKRVTEFCPHCARGFKGLKNHLLNCRRNPNRPSAYMPEERKRMIDEYKNNRYGVKK